MRILCKRLRQLATPILAFLILSFSLQTTWAKVPFVVQPVWSPDGSKIAFAIDNDIEINNAISGKLLFTLRGHTDLITSIAWNPDSELIASSSNDQSVKLWDTTSGRLVRTLTGHNEPVTYVLWLGREKVLSWGFDSRPNLFAWDATTGNLLTQGNGGSVWAASVSPDHQYIAISAGSLTIAILNTDTFEIVALSPNAVCCTNQMSALSWSSDGKRIVTGSLNGLVTIWDAKTVKIIHQFKANAYYQMDSRDVSDLALSWVRDVTFSPDGKSVLAISGDGSLKEWDSHTGVIIQEKQLHNLASAKFSLYTGRLLILESTLLSQTDTPSSSNTAPTFSISTPFASESILQSIAQSCGVQSDIQQSLKTDLQAFVAQVSALNDTQIPAGCKADLLAVADALEAKSH